MLFSSRYQVIRDQADINCLDYFSIKILKHSHTVHTCTHTLNKISFFTGFVNIPTFIPTAFIVWLCNSYLWLLLNVCLVVVSEVGEPHFLAGMPSVETPSLPVWHEVFICSSRGSCLGCERQRKRKPGICLQNYQKCGCFLKMGIILCVCVYVLV